MCVKIFFTLLWARLHWASNEYDSASVLVDKYTLPWVTSCVERAVEIEKWSVLRHGPHCSILNTEEFPITVRNISSFILRSNQAALHAKPSAPDSDSVIFAEARDAAARAVEYLDKFDILNEETCVACPCTATVALLLYEVHLLYKTLAEWDVTGRGPFTLGPYTITSMPHAFHVLQTLSASATYLNEVISHGAVVLEYPGYPLRWLLETVDRMQRQVLAVSQRQPSDWNDYMEDRGLPMNSTFHEEGVKASIKVLNSLVPDQWFVIRGTLLATLRWGSRGGLLSSDNDSFYDEVDADMDVMVVLPVDPEALPGDPERVSKLGRTTGVDYIQALTTAMVANGFKLCLESQIECAEERGCKRPRANQLIICFRRSPIEGQAHFSLDVTLAYFDPRTQKVYSDLMYDTAVPAEFVWPIRSCSLYGVDTPCPNQAVEAVRRISHWTTHDDTCLALPDKQRERLDATMVRQLLTLWKGMEARGLPTLTQDFVDNCQSIVR